MHDQQEQWSHYAWWVEMHTKNKEIVDPETLCDQNSAPGLNNTGGSRSDLIPHSNHSQGKCKTNVVRSPNKVNQMEL